MKKLAIMFVMLLGSVATMQAQTDSSFDFSCSNIITVENASYNPDANDGDGSISIAGHGFIVNGESDFESEEGFFPNSNHYVYVFADVESDGSITFSVESYDGLGGYALDTSGNEIVDASGLSLSELENKLNR